MTPGEPPAIGAALRRLRTRRGLSLERLARASGVSRAMLSQIELGQSAPTITVLWKIAQALEVTLPSLLSYAAPRPPVLVRGHSMPAETSPTGGLSIRTLFTPGHGRPNEVYELRLRESSVEHVSAELLGISQTLVVSSGMVEVELLGDIYQLGPGDSLAFETDVEHTYRTGREPALGYLLRTRPHDLG